MVPLAVQPELILCYFVHSYFCKVDFAQVVRCIMFSSRLFLLYHVLQQVSSTDSQVVQNFNEMQPSKLRKTPLYFSLFQFQT